MEALYVIGILILVVGFGYGLWRSRTRNRANDPLRDEATRELYDEPEAFENGGKQRLEAKLKPED